jgi:hypothetical protein
VPVVVVVRTATSSYTVDLRVNIERLYKRAKLWCSITTTIGILTVVVDPHVLGVRRKQLDDRGHHVYRFDRIYLITENGSIQAIVGFSLFTLERPHLAIQIIPKPA